MNKLKTIILITGLSLVSLCGFAQEKIDDRWIDNNLSIAVTNDQIKGKGVFTFCVIDTSQGYCVENLTTGVEVKAFDREGNEIWKGIGSGRVKKLKLSKPLPEAYYLKIRAFKPYVVNRSTGTLIYQEQPIETKYYIK